MATKGWKQPITGDVCNRPQADVRCSPIAYSKADILFVPEAELGKGQDLHSPSLHQVSSEHCIDPQVRAATNGQL